MLQKSLFAGLGLSMLLLQACGAQSAPAGASTPTAASTPAASAAQAPATSGSVADFDSVLKSSNTAAYISLANANDICQDQVQAITTLTTQLQQQLAQGGNVQTAIDQFNAAMQALASCVTAQAGDANLPAIGQVDPNPTVSSTCTVSTINGQVTQTGDCSNCQVTQNGSSVSASCNAGNPADGNATIAAPTPTPAPTATVGSGSSHGGTITSSNCSVSVVNGQPTMTGDCSNCHVQNSGNSVSVSCSSTN